MQTFFIYGMLLFALLMLALLVMPLRVRLAYERMDIDDLITLEMSLWKFPRFKLQIPIVDLKTNLSGLAVKFDGKTKKSGAWVRRIVTTFLGFPQKKDDIRDSKFALNIPFNVEKLMKSIEHFKKLYHRYWHAIEYLLEHTQCQRLKWCTKFGIGDAAATGYATGALWVLKTTVLGKLFKFVQPPPSQPTLLVQPNFDKTEICLDVDCIFEVRIYHIMVAGMKIAFTRE
ncbi:DUF2953 domain-containing protein [Peptococcaceae bacterium 1198_IL3148]